MKPAVTFPDVEAALAAYLRTAWAARGESYKPVKVGTVFPPERLTGETTWIQVEVESTDVTDYPITERAQVRVVCHAPPDRRSIVKRMASITQALSYVHPGDDQIAGVFAAGGRGGRSAVASDPDTGNLMVWFLLRVATLATPLSGPGIGTQAGPAVFGEAIYGLNALAGP